MVTLARRAERIPFAPVVAILFGLVAAILVAAVPNPMFEAAVIASGLPGLIGAATPPLELIARAAAMLIAFMLTGGLFWAVLTPLTRQWEASARARTPWRDAGYDIEDASVGETIAEAPRRPIFAPDELGAPLMSDAALAVEPELILSEPVATEPLQPVMRAPVTADNSIAALMRRLEDGLAQRGAGDSRKQMAQGY